MNLTKKLQIAAKKIQSTHAEGKNVQFFKELNISMDKYVACLYFHAITMDNVGIVF